MDLVQGSHIVIEGRTDRGVYYLEAPRDRRAVFVMPWYEHTLVGTTEKLYEGDPANVIATQEEIDYLLETPDVPGPVYLAKSEAVYLFEDPELEAMTAGQKVLVRMGSANATLVKEKLTEVKEELNQ